MPSVRGSNDRSVRRITIHRLPPKFVNDSARQRQGLAYGVLSYGLWGLLPVYFHAVSHLPPLEVLSHRIIWSFFLLITLAVTGARWAELAQVFRERKTLVALTLTTLLIAVNWGTYIYAVSTRQVLQSSLGYFTTPLANVLLGVIVLKERLRMAQLGAIVLAAAGLLNLASTANQFPTIALILAVSFSLYGLLRKMIRVDAVVCLLVETLLLLPPAGIYLLHRASVATPGLRWPIDRTGVLLLASGLVTALPLLAFTAAARRLRLSTLGILQYLAPTLQFSLAVFVFGEPFSRAQLMSFVLIWIAVGIYTADSLRAYKRHRDHELAELNAAACEAA